MLAIPAAHAVYYVYGIRAIPYMAVSDSKCKPHTRWAWKI